jgi:hypothetical protein
MARQFDHLRRMVVQWYVWVLGNFLLFLALVRFLPNDPILKETPEERKKKKRKKTKQKGV